MAGGVLAARASGVLMAPQGWELFKDRLFQWTPTGPLSRTDVFSNFRRRADPQSLESLKTLWFPQCLSAQHTFALPIKNLLFSQLAGQEKTIC